MFLQKMTDIFIKGLSRQIFDNLNSQVELGQHLQSNLRGSIENNQV